MKEVVYYVIICVTYKVLMFSQMIVSRKKSINQDEKQKLANYEIMEDGEEMGRLLGDRVERRARKKLREMEKDKGSAVQCCDQTIASQKIPIVFIICSTILCPFALFLQQSLFWCRLHPLSSHFQDLLLDQNIKLNSKQLSHNNTRSYI